MRKKAGFLKDVANAAAEMNGIRRESRAAFDEDLAGGRKEQAIDELKERGFAASAAAKKDEGFAARNGEGDVRNDGTRRNIVYAIADIAEFDSRLRVCVEFRHHFG